MLLEREAELAHLGALVDRTAKGEGRLVLVQGEAGIGKTSLLNELRMRAADGGCRTLAACGGELERDFAWGVVRQLYEAVLASAGDSTRERLLAGAAALAAPVVGAGDRDTSARPARDATLAVNHGLYWLTVHLADERPLVLVVDDIHWADVATLMFLNYLGRRVGELGVVVVAGMRPAEPGAPRELLEPLAELASCERRSLPPLSIAGSAAVIERTLGEPPGQRLLHACHDATGGNPFLLEELLRELQREGIDADDAAADWAGRLGPRAIAHSVLGRLGAMWPDALRLAQAVAVLGTRAEPRLARALAVLDRDAATAAADALADAGVLAPGRPLRFVHPVLRQAIYRDIPEGRRAAAHARAARLLDDDPDRAAVHLLASEPDGDAWVVQTLHAAGARAVAQGSPDAAIPLLRGALAEPPESAARSALLRELGMAAASRGDPQAIAWLEEAIETAPDADARMIAGLAWSLVIALQGSSDDAFRSFLAKLSLTPDLNPETALQAEAFVRGIAVFAVHARRYTAEYGWQTPRRELPPGDTPGARSLLAAATWEAVINGRPMPRVLELAERALARGKLLAETGDSWQHSLVTRAVIFADDLPRAMALSEERLDNGRRRGSLVDVGVSFTLRALANLRRGALREAEADALGGLADAWRLGLPLRIAVLVDVLRESGRLDDAERALVEHGLAGQVVPPPDIQGLWLLESRGRLRLAQGRPEEALTDLLLARDWLAEMQRPDAAAYVWRSDAALAHHALGDADTALARADEHVACAKTFGAPTHLGMALRVLAVVGPVEDAVALLRESVAVLEVGPARLEHAKALVELGSALRRGGHRRDPRAPLEQGMELAHRCRATPLADRARDELKTLGARPRRFVVSGADALTPSERRVADMAASGMTNREIAQALFVTQKTIEVHLSHSYQKLDISSRRELGEALGATG